MINNKDTARVVYGGDSKRRFLIVGGGLVVEPCHTPSLGCANGGFVDDHEIAVRARLGCTATYDRYIIGTREAVLDRLKAEGLDSLHELAVSELFFYS